MKTRYVFAVAAAASIAGFLFGIDQEAQRAQREIGSPRPPIVVNGVTIDRELAVDGRIRCTDPYAFPAVCHHCLLPCDMAVSAAREHGAGVEVEVTPPRPL